jgi:hypothetical protein
VTTLRASIAKGATELFIGRAENNRNAESQRPLFKEASQRSPDKFIIILLSDKKYTGKICG